MKSKFLPLVVLCCATPILLAAEYHVSVTGQDSHPGTRTSPFRTIQKAADTAQPGDIITVHEGVYRERVNPPRGGESEGKRIVYQAAPGAQVEIKGSEVVQGWAKVQEGVWKVTLPNSFFGDFNPYTNVIHGDWFGPRGRVHHTGAVYLNGDWLIEAMRLEEVLMPAGAKPAWLKDENPGLWFAQTDDTQTRLWAQFGSANPNEQTVEINVRQTVFYPDQPGRNYITVRGFKLRHAATPWAPPTAEQIGLLGTHWSRSWIIEDNTVSHSICSGISLGKHGDAFDNTSADTAEGYVKTIERAQAHAIPWRKETVGHHIVRRNTISQCEQAGLVGSLGAAFSLVEDNVIRDIHVRRLFTGAEMAGIKFHAAIDTVIRRNHIYRTTRGLWLDWMAQGTRVSRNLFHDNPGEDLFVEVNHGPFLVDNNLLLSGVSLLDMSEGGAYAHNLFGGRIVNRPEPERETPYHPPHSTEMTGLAITSGGDDRFYNNVFLGDGRILADAQKGNLRELRWIASYGLWGYDGRRFPLQTGGNVYLNGAQPSVTDTNSLVLTNGNFSFSLTETNGRPYLRGALNHLPKPKEAALVTTERLGEAKVPGLPYVNPDGTPIRVNVDYLGRPRDNGYPTPGPFQNPADAEIDLWNQSK